VLASLGRQGVLAARLAGQLARLEEPSARAVAALGVRAGAPGAPPPQEGDIVRLGADPDYSQRSAVVTKVWENHCTVVILDASERFGVDERYPYFRNIGLVRSDFRLRRRVAIAGLKGSGTRHLNGHTGWIDSHPINGHPVFVQKASSPEKAQHGGGFCVRLDDPVSASDPCVLLEPRFLRPCEGRAGIAALPVAAVAAAAGT
ncbi:unnamed protein product, partial [Prorocentrum cordatum]